MFVDKFRQLVQLFSVLFLDSTDQENKVCCKLFLVERLEWSLLLVDFWEFGKFDLIGDRAALRRQRQYPNYRRASSHSAPSSLLNPFRFWNLTVNNNRLAPHLQALIFFVEQDILINKTLNTLIDTFIAPAIIVLWNLILRRHGRDPSVDSTWASSANKVSF